MNYTQREKLIDKLCGAGLMLILVEIVYQVVNSAFTEFNYNLSDVTNWVYIAGGIVLLIAIILLIYAYMKKSGAKACVGMELLVLAITMATLPGSYLEYVFPYNKLNKVYPILFLAYYVGKCIYIAMNVNKTTNKSSKKKAKKKKR